MVSYALRHAGIVNHARVKIGYIDSETITPGNVHQLEHYDAVLVPGGFGKRGIEGKIAAARFAPYHRGLVSLGRGSTAPLSHRSRIDA